MKIQYQIEDGDCWKCTSHCTNSDGYVKVMHNKRQWYGHRYMYVKKHGSIPDEVLRHTCDNRWCINPDHLIPGSHFDNVQDRVERGRSAAGSNNGRSKLTEEVVLKILADTTTPKTQLAKLYKVDPKVIRDIKNGVTWRHITGL